MSVALTDTAARGPISIPLAPDRLNHLYIAGPMTGLPDYNFPAFHEAAEKMRALHWIVHNPADHGLIEGAQKEDYLRWDIAELMQCQAILMLPGWQDSPGARLEYQLAKVLGILPLYGVPT